MHNWIPLTPKDLRKHMEKRIATVVEVEVDRGVHPP